MKNFTKGFEICQKQIIEYRIQCLLELSYYFFGKLPKKMQKNKNRTFFCAIRLALAKGSYTMVVWNFEISLEEEILIYQTI